MFFEKRVERIYRNVLFVRRDNPSGVFYFAPKDFPGLKAYPYTFQSKLGHDLKGFFYCYDDPIPGRLLVFDHGMGNGHRAYMREIQQLAKGGFLVFSYDHTGCMASGGDSIRGFSQSLSDLDDCLKALKGEDALKDRSFSVMGHSWGGYSTMNIAALHPDITHIVSMCGFISVEQILKQKLGVMLRGYRRSLHELERRTNPSYADFDAAETLGSTQAKVLLIYSKDDSVVSKQYHFDPLYASLAGRENIRFLLVDGKDHNPTYTADAVRYRNAFFSELKRREKKKLLETDSQKQEFMAGFDWERMTAQDESVWRAILDALKS